MNWVDFVLTTKPNWRHLEAIDERLNRMQVAETQSRLDNTERIEQLENDLARMLLLVHALSEVCLRKGLVTAEELAAVVQEVDLKDGAADGKLDPGLSRPAEERQRRVAAGEFLGKLQLPPEDTVTPREFLEDLSTSPEPPNQP